MLTIDKECFKDLKQIDNTMNVENLHLGIV